MGMRSSSFGSSIDCMVTAPSTASLPGLVDLQDPTVAGIGHDLEEPQLMVPFDARRVLKVGITCVRFLVRFRRLRFTPEPLSLTTTSVNPYSMRMFRKVIDANAFQIYSHWVKRGEGQNRAALFQHYDKREIVSKQEKKRRK